MSDRTYKVLLAGESKTGKTAWLTRVVSGYFTEQYTPTEMAKYIRWEFDTTVGKVKLEFVDTPAQHSYIVNAKASALHIDAVILFHAQSSIDEFKSMTNLMNELREKHPTTPIVHVISMYDSDIREMFRGAFDSYGEPIYAMSAKTGGGCNAPIDRVLQLISPDCHLLHPVGSQFYKLQPTTKLSNDNPGASGKADANTAKARGTCAFSAPPLGDCPGHRTSDCIFCLKHQEMHDKLFNEDGSENPANSDANMKMLDDVEDIVRVITLICKDKPASAEKSLNRIRALSEFLTDTLQNKL